MYLIPQIRGEEILKYLRKSQTDDPLLSVEEILAKHDQMITELLQMRLPDAGPIPSANIFREIESGETIKSRPAMLELLRLVESPKIKAVAVTEPSRLTRGDLEDIGYLVKILRYTQTIVITLDFVYDLTDEGDRDRFERELMRGNEYLEYTKKIRMNGRLASVKSGNFIGNCAPFGYRKIAVKDGRRTYHTLELHPDQAPVVKRIFELYASGLGATRIALQLDAEHAVSPSGGRWSPESIPSMLTNIHYLGKVKWNHRKTVRTVEDGAVKVSRPVAEEFLVFEGKHPAIIDQELWDRVQAIMRSHPRNPAKKELTNPLAGLLMCECGRMMTGRKYNYPDGRERCAPRVLCINRNKGCGNASARLQDIMDEVIKVLRSAIEDFEVRIEAGTDDSAEVHRLMVERMEKRLAELKKLEVQQWAEKMNSKMPEHVFRALNDPTVAEIEDLEHALLEARDAVPEPVDLQNKVVTFQAAIDALLDPEAPVKEKNLLLKKCIEKITYSRERYTTFGTPKDMVEAPIRLDFQLRV